MEFKVKMTVGPSNVIQKALKGVKKFGFPSKMVAVDCDEAGLVPASLDGKSQVADSIIMEVSRFAQLLSSI